MINTLTVHSATILSKDLNQYLCHFTGNPCHLFLIFLCLYLIKYNKIDKKTKPFDLKHPN